jgi:hypothetical protein
MTQRERWIACRAHAFTVPPDRVALLRAENIREIRWWDPSDLVASGVVTAPRQLASLIEETASGIEPDPGRDLGR